VIDRETELAGRTVLVTGAASGIGRETALAFAHRGCELVLVDIDEDGLGELAGPLEAMGTRCRVFRVDVSDIEQVREMASQVNSDSGGVDVLVNVAGVCVLADIVDTPVEDWEWLLGVNLWGVINTVHCFLPSMIQRRRGHIVNIASGAGLFALAGIGAYSTSKFAVVGFSEALRQEVTEHGVAVTVVCPGGTSTPIIGHMRVHGFSPEKTLHRAGFAVKRSMPPENLARKIVSAVERKRFLVVTTFFVYFHYYLKRLSPALFRLTTRLGRKGLNAFLR